MWGNQDGGGAVVGVFPAMRECPPSESAPNPPITPLHVGHSADKPNNSDERENQIASR